MAHVDNEGLPDDVRIPDGWDDSGDEDLEGERVGGEVASGTAAMVGAIAADLKCR